ncbi:MAG TPA: PAS domain-containing protein [candidate division Zixibacteria bacterium]|nr:PAS domain-containing protein [candidate division Zixibacteria bacterium]
MMEKDYNSMSRSELIAEVERLSAQAAPPLADVDQAMMARCFDLADVILIAIDPHGDISLINERGCEILELPREKAIGMNWFNNFLPKDQVEAVSDIFNKLMSGEVESTVEFVESPLISSKGKIRTILWHNTIIHDESGRPIYSLSSGEDITRRKAADKRLRQTSDLLESWMSNSPTLAFAKDRDGRLTFVNAATAKTFGMEPEEMIGMTEYDLFPDDPDLAEEMRANDLEVVQSRSPLIINEMIKVEEGLKYYVSVKFPLFNEHGEIYSIAGVATDVTELNQAKRSLEEAESRYQAVVEGSLMAIMVVQDGKYIFCNRAGAMMLGFDSPEDMIGYELIESIEPQYHSLVKTRLGRISNGLSNEPMEFDYIRHDGLKVRVESTSMPIMMNQRPAIMIIGRELPAPVVKDRV